jgi:hypothetical protein
MKLWEFVTLRPALQETLKGILKIESKHIKWHYKST